MSVFNKDRKEIKTYKPGQQLFVKQNSILGFKLSPRYKIENLFTKETLEMSKWKSEGE